MYFESIFMLSILLKNKIIYIFLFKKIEAILRVLLKINAL